MLRITNLIVFCRLLQCLGSFVDEAVDSTETCLTGEEACARRGKSMLQISSSFTAMHPRGNEIAHSAVALNSVVDQSPQQRLSQRASSSPSVQLQSRCHANGNGRAVPLNKTGFNSVQNQCCAPVMANFIEQLLIQNGSAVCNVGALNGLTSYYDCPGDGSYAALLTELQTAQHGLCAWVKSPQAATCPVMDSSCPHYPQAPSPGSSPNTPLAPSAQGPAPQPQAPSPSAPLTPGQSSAPAPSPTTTDPCTAPVSLSYTCGSIISTDCQSEYDNAVANNNLNSFCNRCATETGSNPLRNRCILCCNNCGQMSASAVTTSHMPSAPASASSVCYITQCGCKPWNVGVPAWCNAGTATVSGSWCQHNLAQCSGCGGVWCPA